MPVAAVSNRKAKLILLLRIVNDNLEQSDAVSALHKLVLRTIVDRFTKVLIATDESKVDEMLATFHTVTNLVNTALDDESVSAKELGERITDLLSSISK